LERHIGSEIKVQNVTLLILQFGFVIFWQKNIGAKAARKILMNLTSWDCCKLD